MGYSPRVPCGPGLFLWGLFFLLSLKLSSLFIMVYANIKRTIAIDLSPLSPDLSRQDLVRILISKFENVTIKAIQFVPVKLVHITFEDSATREHYAHVENIVLEGISCRVLGVGPLARTVYIYHYPFEEDDNRLKLALGAFGKVLDIRHQHYAGFNSVCTGTRLVKMEREHPIRRNLDVGGYRVKVWYIGQPLECDICSRGHISRDCPVRDKCRKCLEPGHMARNCPNPPRAWDVVNDRPGTGGVSSASSDPTPAEATQASGGSAGGWPTPSSSVLSGVGADLIGDGGLTWGERMEMMRDNELSPPSASDSDSSLGLYVSLSSSSNVDKDSNVNNDKDVNVSNEQCSYGDNDMSQSILSNQSDCSNDSNVIKGSESSLNNDMSQSILSNQNGTISNDSNSNESSVNNQKGISNNGINVSEVPRRSAGDSGPLEDVDASMAEVSILGKRAISETASTDSENASGGTQSAPKKGSVRASRAKKVALSEPAPKKVASSQGRRSR